ncbi:molybdopterin molybdotransferase MoeA [Joostella sp.]|uniref:molybdopterin molybdotransferase MoeA n=1 Tax=Joostella sp. TaxID=2231138 RepID=UPI003A8D78FC
MISFEEAHSKVLEKTISFDTESVLFTNSLGRVLAEDILADRDFPPFDRVTKDGIVVNYEAIKNGKTAFSIEGVVAAGTPKSKLKDKNNCLEIMTGAVMPENADTVIMYEDITIKEGKAILNSSVKAFQNIHKQGVDTQKGAILVKKNTRITAAEIGILAAVGSVEVEVKKLPQVTLISTGDELVAVHEKPAAHQIRNSNMLSLHALLLDEHIHSKHIHLNDNKEEIKNNLIELFSNSDILMLSGGVSKGKFDYIPEVLEDLGVEKVFHRVKQRPGKPFWFGIHKASKTVIFSFPGNPVSTFANYHVYFKDWLHKSLELEMIKNTIILGEEVSNKTDLTLFISVKVKDLNGEKRAFRAKENGSGDLTSLALTDGFIQLPPRENPYKKGEAVTFIASR